MEVPVTEINGLTRVVVHLAYPSAHVKTPQLFNARCRERGINAVLVPWQVHPDHLAKVMAALRVSESVSGVIVTIPHKETVAALCDRLDGAAEQLSVANVVRKDDGGLWHGRALDGVGFVAGLKAEGLPVKGRNALLAGAGGVAVAIAEALLAEGAASLTIANRTRDRAEKLAERLRSIYPEAAISAGTADATGCDLIVNGTSLGMKETDSLPLDIETVASGAIVAEVIMEPAETRLLQEAARRGAIPHAGRHMLTGQIDAFIDFLLPEQAVAAA